MATTKSLNVTELTGIKIKRELEKGKDGQYYNKYTFCVKIRNKSLTIRLLSGSQDGAERFENLNLCFDENNEAQLIRETTVDKANDNRTTITYKAFGSFDDGDGFIEEVFDVVRPAQRSDASMLDSFISNVLRRRALENGEDIGKDYIGEKVEPLAFLEENAELAKISKKSNSKKEE